MRTCTRPARSAPTRSPCTRTSGWARSPRRRPGPGRTAGAAPHPVRPRRAPAATLHPYLGVAAVAPAVARARAYGRGAFVLALTTTPEAAAPQRAAGPDGRSAAQRVVDEIAQLNQGDAEVTEGPAAGSFGVVIGATVGAGGLDLSRLNGPVLVPGLGAQGA